jgi:NAD(P)-dependent dehydrogenase (short-subunit alcohol dehydrogenase family)
MKKTVLITGTSSGIGRAAARLFAANGWNVLATMRNPDAEMELNALEGVKVLRLDVQDESSIYHAIADGIDHCGRIDALVNNAGYSSFGIFEATGADKVQEQFDVNVFGVMNVTRALLPHFRRNREGIIINLSSRAGLVGLPMISLYCATKHALEGFTESLAFELAAQAIVVKLVEPSGGVTDTAFSARMAAEHALLAVQPDYEAFADRTAAAFAGLRAARKVSAEEVAGVIYEAATDGKSRLRYFTGEDVGGFVQAKRDLSDEAFLAFMRGRFPS